MTKTDLFTPEFPVMNIGQVEAITYCRAALPVLDEWWVRYIKAWCKDAGGKECQ